jgi:hypothetical protein
VNQFTPGDKKASAACGQARLSYAAETIGDERNELRRAAAHADQRASVSEGLARGKRS